MTLARTPFYDAHIAAGGRMVEFAGWEMPVQYAGLAQEHAAVRTGVGVFDVSHMGEVRYTGPNALASLQWLASNDVSELSIGQAQYAVMCNASGGAVDDIFIYRLGEQDYLVVVNAANRAKDVAWMRANNRGAEIDDQSDAWALLAVQGPGAEAALDGLCSADLGALESRGVVACTVAGVEGCFIARTGYTGEDGFEVFAPADRAAPLWDAIVGAGAVPCGLGARDTLRLEVRNALYGHELTDETSPFQAGVGFVVRLDKEGGFLGSDAVAARKGNEPRRIVAIVIDGKRIARDGMAVLHDGAEVGVVTSGTRSPTLEQGICLAYVDAALTRPGTRLVIDVRGREAEGEVIRGPFYRRAK